MRNGSPLSRTAALLLLAAGLWSAWALVLAPALTSVAADRARLRDLRAALAGGAVRADMGTAEHKRAAAFIDALSWRLDRSSPELLSAQLQRSVESLAAAAGASVASSRTRPVQADGGFARIGLDFDIQATLPALQKLLVQIGQARPRIFVDRLTVQAAENGGSARGADGQSELGVSMQVEIYAARLAETAL